MKEDLRRETHGTAVGGDRGAHRPVARRRGGRASAESLSEPAEARGAVDHSAGGQGPVRRVAGRARY